MEKIIEIKNMTYYYKSFTDDGESQDIYACRDINLDIYGGEFVALVGHNGSGKSTLAKLLNALLTPRIGSVTVFNMDTADKDNLFDIRKSVGMVFQNPDNQMVASIIEEDVAFGPENLGLPREEIVERVNWALNSVNMKQFAKRSPHRLSGGQKQRIAIAGALAIKPQVLVLDESTAMLDPQGRREVLDIAHKLNKEHGMTIILITHFMEEVMESDRVIVMNKGRIEMIDTPQAVFAQADKLVSIDLALPRVVQLGNMLLQAGLDVGEYCTDIDALGDKLCQLL